MRATDFIDEMSLTKYQPMGDFDKPGPFRGADKKLVPHPKSELKTQQFFEQTPYDFRLFFSNIPGTGKYSEHGPMSPEQIKEVFKDRADEIIDGSENAITVVFVGNKGDAKVILTPWMMAHRLGHAIAREYAVGSRGSRDAAAWYAAEKHFFENINSILKDYYGIYAGAKGFTFELSSEYNSLFNAIGTQRSSRQNLIRRPYEFFYELFAQYLGTGTVKMNPLPMTLGYGRKAWGRSTKAMNVKPEYRDQADLARVTDVLGHDMEIMFSDVLSNAEGKIFVM